MNIKYEASSDGGFIEGFKPVWTDEHYRCGMTKFSNIFSWEDEVELVFCGLSLFFDKDDWYKFLHQANEL